MNSYQKLREMLKGAKQDFEELKELDRQGIKIEDSVFKYIAEDPLTLFKWHDGSICWPMVVLFGGFVAIVFFA